MPGIMAAASVATVLGLMSIGGSVIRCHHPCSYGHPMTSPKAPSRPTALWAVCAVALVALVLGAASARATTLVLTDGTAGPQPYQGWVDAALVPTPPGEVTLELTG